MKKLITLTALALLTGSSFAACVTQYLKMSVINNPNVPVQSYNSLVYAFSTNGLNTYDAGDGGNQNAYPANIGNEIYPFSLDDNNNVVSFSDSRPDLFSYQRIKMGFYSKLPATIQVCAAAFGSCADSSYRPTYAWLEQISTGQVFDILHDTATITLQQNIDFTADFYLHTGPYIKVSCSDETCFETVDGAIGIENPNCGNWALTVYRDSLLFFNDSVLQPDMYFQNLVPGNYIAIVSMNGVAVMNVPLTIHSAPQIFPSFTTDIANPTTDDVITFTSTTSGAVVYAWDFGNGDNDATNSVSYQYPFDGQFVVSLTATSETGCQAIAYDTITVTPGSGAPNMAAVNPANNNMSFHPDNSISATGPTKVNADITSDNGQRIMIHQEEAKDLWIVVSNTAGQIITVKESNDAAIDLPVPAKGIYIVKVVAAGYTQSKTIMVAN
jgi:hypothetical protein